MSLTFPQCETALPPHTAERYKPLAANSPNVQLIIKKVIEE